MRRNRSQRITCLWWARTTRSNPVQTLFVLALGILLPGVPACQRPEKCAPCAGPAASRAAPHPAEAPLPPPTTISRTAQPVEPLSPTPAAQPLRTGLPPSPHHWVQSDQLYAVMKRLGASTAANWPTTLPDDPEVPVTPQMQAQAFRDGALLASALADSAHAIPRSVDLESLSEADRVSFVSGANVLSEQARDLGRAARRKNVEGMQRHLESIRSSCISCHTRFQDISGKLPPRA